MFGLLLTGCSNLLPNQPNKNSNNAQESQKVDDFEAKTREIYNLYLAQGGTLTYEQWLESIRGADGKDGQTPRIGTNGNWWIGNTDTGVKAEGNDGKDGTDGAPGADGKDGKDGQNGKSAYELYVEYHPNYCGSEAEWVDDLALGKLGTTITITFCDDEEEVIETINAEFRSRINPPSNPTKFNYEFAGWKYQNTIINFDTFIFTNNLSLVASWNYVGNMDPLEYVQRGNSYTVVGFKKGHDSSVVIPETYNGKPVTAISDEAFREDQDLESIFIPSSITSIAYGAFQLCLNLKTVSFAENSSLNYLGGWAFAYCGSLESINLPDTITTFEQGVFNYCESLKQLKLPSSLKYITNSCFYKCYSLTHLILPASLETIENDTFTYCYRLVEIVNHSNLNIQKNSDDNGGVGKYAVNIFKDESSLTLKTNEDGFATYDDGVGKVLIDYYGNSKIVSIPANLVYKLADYAFFSYREGVANYLMPILHENIREIIIPEGVTTIGTRCFEYCIHLYRIAFPSTIQSVGESILYQSYCLSEVINKSNVSIDCNGSRIRNENESQITFDNNFVIYSGSTCVGYLGDEISIKIPNYVTQIKSNAFELLKNLEEVEFPDSLNTLGSRAFASCYKLKKVHLGENVNYIDDICFEYCYSLSEINIPDNVERIGIATFENCKKLKKVDISSESKLKEIQGSAFYLCESLSSFYFPKEVESFSNNAFDKCNRLEAINVSENNPNFSSINGVVFDKSLKTLICCPISNSFSLEGLPASVEIIGHDSMSYNLKISSATIKEGVKEIEFMAFYGCHNLKNISLPLSITKIGSYAFGGCPIRNVYYAGSLAEWYAIENESGDQSFSDGTIIHCNDGEITISFD